MTTMNFEDAVTELVRRISAASPEEQEGAKKRLRGAIAAADRAPVRRECLADEDDWFDNMPV